MLVHVIASEIKACKIDECLDIKHCSCEKGLISNLVSERKDEVLNITEKSLDDKRKTCEKKSSYLRKFISNSMFIISCCF